MPVVAAVAWCLGRELRIGCEGCTLRCDLCEVGPDFEACWAAEADVHTTSSHDAAANHRMEEFILISTLMRSEVMPGDKPEPLAIIGHLDRNSSRHVCGRA